MTDYEIQKQFKLKDIKSIAKKLGYKKSNLFCYGKKYAKMDLVYGKKNGKLILVTAINPTTAGIGKTTVSIGLCDAMNSLGNKTCLALREPSLGPVFGTKGGATGGGYSQITPMEDINLHFTGDFHAITSANNLLCSLIDNHIYQGNELAFDTERITFKRCIDINDRALKEISILSDKNKNTRQDSFVITAASEIMAILSLCNDFEDLKKRLGNILCGYSLDNEPIFAKQLSAENSMAILLKDAIKPNLVQTLYSSPAIVHCGPFANIAHGCNSVIATRLAKSYSDYVVTEAGFGSDLGAEKFFDVKCRISGLKPSCVVLVATIQSLKLHGGQDSSKLENENVNTVRIGMGNLLKHIDNIQNVYHLPLVVTLNKYESDTDNEINVVYEELNKLGINLVVNNVWAEGKKGAIELAKKVVQLCKQENNFEYCYKIDDTIKAKITNIAKRIYGATDVNYSELANDKIKMINEIGFSNLPIVIAKTQYSLSDKKDLKNNPSFKLDVNDIVLCSGAGFIVVICGKMMLMPGLSKNPNANNMFIDNNMNIKGLF